MMLHDTIVGVFDGANPALDGLTKNLSKPARLLREAVTRMPDFLLANTSRDSVNAWIAHGIHRTPIHALASSYKRLFQEVIKLRSASWSRTSRAGNEYTYVTLEVDDKQYGKQDDKQVESREEQEEQEAELF